MQRSAIVTVRMTKITADTCLTFQFRKYDSVRACIRGLGRLDFHHIGFL